MLMKKVILFLCLLLTTGYEMNAQATFAPLGAEWWYNGNNWNYMYGPLDGMLNETWSDHVIVTGDTVIQGINCRKVVATRTSKTGLHPDSLFVSAVATMYFYDNTDTVFFFNSASGSFD